MNTPKRFLPPHLLWTPLTISLPALLEIFGSIPRAAAQTFIGRLGSNSTTYPSSSGLQIGRLIHPGYSSFCYSGKGFPAFTDVAGLHAYDAYKVVNAGIDPRRPRPGQKTAVA
jgi:hypothetical protein